MEHKNKVYILLLTDLSHIQNITILHNMVIDKIVHTKNIMQLKSVMESSLYKTIYVEGKIERNIKKFFDLQYIEEHNKTIIYGSNSVTDIPRYIKAISSYIITDNWDLLNPIHSKIDDSIDIEHEWIVYDIQTNTTTFSTKHSQKMALNIPLQISDNNIIQPFVSTSVIKEFTTPNPLSNNINTSFNSIRNNNTPIKNGMSISGKRTHTRFQNGQHNNTQQSLQQSLQQPVQQPVQQSVQQSIQQPVQQSVQQPVQQSVQQSLQQPVQQSGQQSLQQPVQQSLQQPVQQSGQQPVHQSGQQHSSQLLQSFSIDNLITKMDSISRSIRLLQNKQTDEALSLYQDKLDNIIRTQTEQIELIKNMYDILNIKMQTDNVSFEKLSTTTDNIVKWTECKDQETNQYRFIRDQLVCIQESINNVTETLYDNE